MFIQQKRNEKTTFDETLGFFPFGFQYHRAPTPLPQEWDGDLKRIASLGYTHVQFRPQWRWHERIARQRTWDDLDRLFDLAATYRLRVVLKPMLETAPDWVYTELNGSRIGFHGVPISPFAHGAYYVGGWWPCFDNPKVIEAATDFVIALTERYHRHPALWCYDAWNEPVSRPIGQCCCEHSQASYRLWLKKKYGTIERLNETFGKAWTHFDTIHPPPSAADYMEMFLWRKWAGHAVAEQVRFVSKAIRQVHPDAHILVHVGGSLIQQDPICNTSNDLLNRQAGVDRYGTSLWIPLHPSSPLEHLSPERQSAWLRRVDPHYWCHEFYPNQANWVVPPTPQTLARLIWLAIAGGADGFTFWQYRSERVGCETNGFGLMNIDGSETLRSQAADDIAGKLRQHATNLAKTRRVSSGVALLYSHDSDMIGRIQKMPCGIESVEREIGDGDYPYKKAISAAHALYYYLGLAPDYVVPGDSLDHIHLLHVTAAEMIDASTASWLEAFVRRGGKLIVELPFACRDERTWVTPMIPCHHLADLLGYAEADRIVANPNDRWKLNGIELPAGVWRISLRPSDDAQALAYWSDQSVSAIKKQIGQGMSVTLGGSISLGFANRWDDPAFKALASVLMDLGMPMPAWANSGLVVAKRQGSEDEYLFVFNHSDQSRSMPLAVDSYQRIDMRGVSANASPNDIQGGGYWIGRKKTR